MGLIQRLLYRYEVMTPDGHMVNVPLRVWRLVAPEYKRIVVRWPKFSKGWPP